MRQCFGLALWLSLCLTGCATSYGNSGLTGGYASAVVTERLIQVSFHGNGYITAATVQQYALYRCAEMAKAAGYTYFVVYDSLTSAARDLPASLPRVGSLGGKPTAFGFLAFEKEHRQGAMEVSEVMARIQPLIDQSNGSEKKSAGGRT